MPLMIDTHALVWIGEASPRISSVVQQALFAPDAELIVSAVTAYEYADLLHRGRLPDAAGLEALRDRLMFRIADFPGTLWPLAAALPPIHRDPVDRMLIAHAIALGATLVSADEIIRAYPVETLW